MAPSHPFGWHPLGFREASCRNTSERLQVNVAALEDPSKIYGILNQKFSSGT